MLTQVVRKRWNGSSKMITVCFIILQQSELFLKNVNGRNSPFKVVK